FTDRSNEILCAEWLLKVGVCWDVRAPPRLWLVDIDHARFGVNRAHDLNAARLRLRRNRRIEHDDLGPEPLRTFDRPIDARFRRNLKPRLQQRPTHEPELVRLELDDQDHGHRRMLLVRREASYHLISWDCRARETLMTVSAAPDSAHSARVFPRSRPVPKGIT